MSLIEGVGDEVLLVFGVAFLVLILTIAWISTNVRDVPPISVIVLDRRRWQQLVHRLRITSATIIRIPLPGQQAPPHSDQGQDVGVQDVTDIVSEDQSETREDESVSVNPSEDSEAVREGSVTEVPVEAQETPPTRDHEAAGKDRLSCISEEVAVDCDNRDNSKNSSSDEAFTPLVDNRPNERVEQTSEAVSPSQTEAGSTDTDFTTDPVSAPSDEGPRGAEWEALEEAGYIRIRIKYLDDRQKLVIAKPDTTIGQFKRWDVTR